MKYRRLLLVILSLCGAPCLISCQKDLIPRSNPHEAYKAFSIDIPNRCDTVLYKGTSVSVPFHVSNIQTPETLKVRIKSSKGADSSVEYDNYRQTGTLVYTVKEDYANIVLNFSDGKMSEDFSINASTYYLSFNTEKVIVVPEEGGEYAFTIETNLPEEKVFLKADPWLASRREDDRVIVRIAANSSVDERMGTLSASIQEPLLEPAIVKFRQDWLLVNGEGMVPFKDKRFKKTILAVADRDKDQDISMEEAKMLKEINAAGKGIEDISGIECFSSVEKLDLRNNDIRKVNLDNPAVYSNLKYIDLTGNTNLEETINISGCYAGVGIHFFVDNRYSHKLITNEPTYYESTDYSFDGLHEIEKHTKGKGIQLVFCTTAYIDKDYQNGAVRELVEYQIDQMFSVEPFASLKGYFDVSFFAFTAPNSHERARVVDSAELYEKYKAVFDEKKYRIRISMNTDGYHGEGLRAYAQRFIYHAHTWPGDVNLVEKRRVFCGNVVRDHTITHEMGHAIGGLQDEYDEDRVHDDAGTMNYTKDIKSIPWQRFLDHEHYKDRVGIYPRNDGYVPSKTSMMGDHHSSPVFNSPSRYAIYRNVMYLSNWDPYNWSYPDSWEEFLVYDQINDDVSI